MRVTYGAPWVSKLNLLPLVLIAIVRLLCCSACGCSSADPAPARAVVVCYGPDDPELDAGLCAWPAPDAGPQ